MAVDVIERACRLSLDVSFSRGISSFFGKNVVTSNFGGLVKRTLLPKDGQILGNNDQTLVTIVDFSVQVLMESR